MRRKKKVQKLRYCSGTQVCTIVRKKKDFQLILHILSKTMTTAQEFQDSL